MQTFVSILNSNRISSVLIFCSYGVLLEKRWEIEMETAAQSIGSAQAHVLLVDDDPQIRRLYQRFLAAAQVDAHVAANPAEAFEWLEHNPQVNVLVTDYLMPEQDGISFIRAVRQRGYAKAGLQTLLVTGQPTLESALECFDLNLCGYLRKPLAAEELVKAVKRAALKAKGERQSSGAAGTDDVKRRTLSQLSESMRMVSRQLESVTAELHGLGAVERVAVAELDLDAADQTMSSEKRLQLIALIDRLDAIRCDALSGQVQSDPAWNMMMELTKSRLLGFKVSITSLCLASKAPVTTALRKLEKLIADELVVRVADSSDRRRSYVEISPACEALVLSVLRALDAMINANGPATFK